MLIIFVIIVAMVLVLLLSLWYLKNDPNYITRFLKDNPNRTSLYLISNDEVLISYKADKLMPLASTAKIVIALAFAEQVTKGLLSTTEIIDLKEINKFYLPGTDAGAHKNWLKELEQKQLLQNNSIALDEVVKGMIKFSSNANAEWLIAKIGKENIETTMKNAGIRDHTIVYPFVSSLIACAKNSDVTDLIKRSWEYHEKLKNDENDVLKAFKMPDLKVQKIWSDHLPASTTKEYCVLMNKINTGKCFNDNACLYAKEILGWPQINEQVFSTFGIKGGSTAFVVTEALYATDAAGNNMALAIFFNDLKDWERVIIEWNLDKFELKMILDEKFRNKVRKALLL